MDGESKERRGGRRAGKMAKGGERPGAKANKEALEEIQRRLDQCVLKEDFEVVNEEVQRSVASVTVFRQQMKIFEKKFRTDRRYDDELSQTRKNVEKTARAFEKERTPVSQTNSSSVESKMAQSAQAASNTKKAI